jgi:hypothetical protein
MQLLLAQQGWPAEDPHATQAPDAQMLPAVLQVAP